jgi:hypothetical protein
LTRRQSPAVNRKASEKIRARLAAYHPAVDTALEFDTTADSLYHIVCDYGVGREGPQAVLAVGSGVAGRIFSLVGKALLSIFCGMGLGVCIILTVLILRERSKKETAKVSQPASYPA